MAKANSVSAEDWKGVSQISNNQGYFTHLSRIYIAKHSLPAQKLTPSEFFIKP